MANRSVAPGLPEAALYDLMFATVMTLGGFMLLRGARRSMNLEWDRAASRRPFRTRRWDIALTALLFLLPVGTSQASRNADGSSTVRSDARLALIDAIQASRNADGSSTGTQPTPSRTVPVVDYEAAARDWVSAVLHRAPFGSNLEARMEHCRDSDECIEAITRMFDGACRMLDSDGSDVTMQAIREVFDGIELTTVFAAEGAEMMVDEFADAVLTSC